MASRTSEADYYQYLVTKYYENEYYHNQGQSVLAITPYGSTGTLSSAITKNTLNWKLAFDILISSELANIHITELGLNGEIHDSMKVAIEWILHSMRNIMENSDNGNFVISGASGSGKTEFAKVIIQVISQLQFARFGTTAGLSLLNYYTYIAEWFGNAPTTLNKNSSRYGRVTTLEFDKKTHHLINCQCTPYLIEKSRITKNLIDKNESYHALCYVSVHRSLPKELIDYCEILNIDHQHILHCLTIVLELLRIADLCTKIDDYGSLITYINLLNSTQFGLAGIVKDCLRITSQNYTDSKKIDKQYELPQYVITISTLAQNMYLDMFKWLTNVELDKNPFSQRVSSNSSKQNNSSYAIKLIDFFGFESFEYNELFQLLVNYTNEELNYLNLQDCIVNESNELHKEGLLKEPIELDSKYLLKNYIHGHKQSILSIISEESQLNGKDYKSISLRIQNELRTKTKKISVSLKKPEIMVVEHYVQTVEYTLTNILSQNTQSARLEIDSAMATIFYKKCNTNTKSLTTPLSPSRLKRYIVLDFVRELNHLLNMLMNEKKYYVKCVQPNRVGQKARVDAKVFENQLEAVGAFNAYRIRKNYTENRLAYSEFIAKYRMISDYGNSKQHRKIPSYHDQKGIIQNILTDGFVNENEYRIGESMVFYSDKTIDDLNEIMLSIMNTNAITIQKNIKRKISHSYYQKLRNMVIFIQHMWHWKHKYRTITEMKNRKKKAIEHPQYQEKEENTHYQLHLITEPALSESLTDDFTNQEQIEHNETMPFSTITKTENHMINPYDKQSMDIPQSTIVKETHIQTITIIKNDYNTTMRETMTEYNQISIRPITRRNPNRTQRTTYDNRHQSFISDMKPNVSPHVSQYQDPIRRMRERKEKIDYEKLQLAQKLVLKIRQIQQYNKLQIR